jgi:hypothetical protein
MPTKLDARLRTTMRRIPEYHNHGHSIRMLQTNRSMSYRSFICLHKCELVNKSLRSFSTRLDGIVGEEEEEEEDDDDDDFYIPPLDLLSPPLAIRLPQNSRFNGYLSPFPLHVSNCRKVVKTDSSSAIKGAAAVNNNLDMTVARLKAILRGKELGISMKSMKSDEWRGRWNTMGKSSLSSQEIAHLLR